MLAFAFDAPVLTAMQIADMIGMSVPIVERYCHCRFRWKMPLPPSSNYKERLPNECGERHEVRR